MILVGPFEEDQISNKEIIKNIIDHPNIIHVGRVMQEDVPPYILLADVFVLPCWGEGFGNVLIQAAAMGKPVITTKATGTMDAVLDNFNGILVRPKDTNALFEALKLMYENHDLRENFGNNGLIWAQNFDRESIWNELNKIYLC